MPAGWALFDGTDDAGRNIFGWRGGPDVVIYPGANVFVADVGLATENVDEKQAFAQFEGTIYALDAAPVDFGGRVYKNRGQTPL